MALLKKVSPLWSPAEKKDLKIGEILEISDYTALVRQGMAVMVDESGNEIPMPNSTLTCPVCYQKIPGTLKNFTEHVELRHAPVVKGQVTAANPPVSANPAPVVEEAKTAEEVATPVAETPKVAKEAKTEKKVA